ncbi:MAG: hypothetical protein LBN99_03635 [Oscillospiraceae bacterium]|nr:hypothetical protein [Oscillospiraceae bacterium]
MKNEFLIDLNDHASSWIYPVEVKMNGVIGEHQSTIIMGEGPHKMFCFTDSVMHPIPEGANPDDFAMMHEHRIGFEIFFVDSGKMWLYGEGYKCLVLPGDILFLPAYRAHGMVFLEDVKYRGIFHDLSSCDDAPAMNALIRHSPGAVDSEEFQKTRGGGGPSGDFVFRERAVFEELPVEKVSAVRSPKRPLSVFELDGVTMKMISARWENSGVCEMWCAELKKGFKAEWDKFPKNHELWYVREGEVKFKVYEEEFVAKAGCLVNIPKFASHSIEALTDAEVYDCGGITFWSALLNDVASVKKYDPERAAKPETIPELKAKFGCDIKSFGLK